MTVYTLQAPMPTLRMVAGMKLRLQAIDPTTGLAVSGVTVAAWTIYGDVDAGAAGGLDLVPALPLLTYGPGGLS